MAKHVWGNVTWYLLHTMADKLKPEHNAEIPEMLSQIFQICDNLPCPDCAQHAVQLFKTANTSRIKNKEALVCFFHEFHNHVNERLKKPYFSLELCNETYKKGRLIPIIQYFFSVMKNIRGHERAMIYSYRRNQCLIKFSTYLTTHLHMFEI